MRWIKELIEKRQNDNPIDGVLARIDFHGADIIAIDPRLTLDRPWIKHNDNEIRVEYITWDGCTCEVRDSIAFPSLQVKVQNPNIYHKPLPSHINWPPKSPQAYISQHRIK